MKLLRILNIVDTDNTLSISHLALAACLILLAIDPGWEKLIAFGLALLNFNAKKLFAYVRWKKEAEDLDRFSAMQEHIDRLQREFEKLNAAVSFKAMR